MHEWWILLFFNLHFRHHLPVSDLLIWSYHCEACFQNGQYRLIIDHQSDVWQRWLRHYWVDGFMGTCKGTPHIYGCVRAFSYIHSWTAVGVEIKPVQMRWPRFTKQRPASAQLHKPDKKNIFIFSLCAYTHTHTHTYSWIHTELYASGPSCSNCWEWERGIGSWLSFLSNLALPDLRVKRSGENLIKEIEVTRSGESRCSDSSLWKRRRRLFFIRIQILVLHIVAASCVF